MSGRRKAKPVRTSRHFSTSLLDLHGLYKVEGIFDAR
jgi:hypothetical protein